jgi:hypothetical protein
MSDETLTVKLRDQLAEVIREFPFDNYGLDDVAYLLEGEPATQEWVPALADAVHAVVRSLEAQVTAARKYADEMRDFCSPHGVSTHYADQLIQVMDRAKGDQS